MTVSATASVSSSTRGPARDGTSAISATGSASSAVLLLHPTEGNAAVVLTNGVGGIHLVREIMAAVAKVYDWPDYLSPLNQPVVLEEEDFERVVGRYRFGFDGLIELQRVGDELWLHGATKDDFRSLSDRGRRLRVPGARR